MVLARLASTSIPTLKSCKFHAQSGLHRLAVQVHWGHSFTYWTTPSVLSPMVSRYGPTHGLPDLKQIGRAWFWIRNRFSKRSFSSSSELEDFFGDAPDAAKACESDETLGWLARCMSEILHVDWHAEVKLGESIFMSFDGHKEWDEVHFSTISLPLLKPVQGLLGLITPFSMSKSELATASKCERTVKQMKKAVELFATRTSAGAGRQKVQDRVHHCDESVVDAFWTKLHAIATDRCAEAQKSGRMIANELAKACGLVAPDTAHMLKTWLESATKSEPELNQLDDAVFSCKGAPAKTLRYSAKEKGILNAYQTEERSLSVPAELPESMRVSSNWASAAHRWESEKTNHVSLCMAYRSFLWKTSDASTDKTYKPESRRLNANAVRNLGTNERGTILGMKTDLLAMTKESLEQVEGDDQDSSEVGDVLEGLVETMERSFVDGEILTEKGAASYTQMMLRTLQPPQTFHFGDGEVAAIGWSPDASRKTPAFAVNALVKFQRITKLVRKLKDAYFEQELPDVWMFCFNTRLWLQQAQSDNRVRNRLHSFFEKLSKHYRLPTNGSDFEVLLRAALDYRNAKDQSLKHCTDEKLKRQKLKSLNKDSWRHAVTSTLQSHSMNNSMRVTMRWLNYKSSSCACERDIKILKELSDRGGAHSVGTIRDFLAITRYGPSSIADLIGKELDSSGNVQLFPKPICVRVLDTWVKLRGRRHKVNTKARTDVGKAHQRQANVSGKTLVQLETAQHSAMRSIANSEDLKDHGRDSIFHSPMSELRVDPKKLKLSSRASAILKKFQVWTSHRAKQASSDHAIRFAMSSKDKQRLIAKRAAARQFKQQLGHALKASVKSDVLVVVDAQVTKYRVGPLPNPFLRSTLVTSADLILVPSLDRAKVKRPTKCELKDTSKISMNGTILGAMLLGKRIATPSYISAASRALASNVSSGDFQQLPVSIKFTPVVKSRQCSLLIDGIWPSEFPNVVKCLRLAASLPSSRWTLYNSVDQRAAFAKLKEKSDASLVAARKKSAKSGEAVASTVDRFDSHHVVVDSYNVLCALVMCHVVTDRTRSTHGRFLAAQH